MAKLPNIVYKGHPDQLPPTRPISNLEPKWKVGDVVVRISGSQLEDWNIGEIGVVHSLGSTTNRLAFLTTKEETKYADICVFHTNVEIIGNLYD